METKKFLIIGGSSGIGLEIVKALCEADNEIFVASRTNDQLSQFGGVHHLPLDVQAEPFSLEGLPDVLDGMVYCPGTIRLKPFQRLTIDDFLEDFQINFLGAVKTIQACLSHLKKSAAGAKAAVEGLTRSLAAEFAPRIRVNAIAPSLTDTPLAQNLLSSKEKRQASADRHPLKRIGTPQEIARLAVHLLSDASAWLTGQIIYMDGGMSSLRTLR